MKLHPLLNYGGNCAEAFQFYRQHLGAKLVRMTRYSEQPHPEKVPSDQKNFVLHARLELGDTLVMGNDVPPEHFQPMRSAYLCLSFDSTPETERVYALLAEGGQVFMPLEETFFAFRFAMLRDRFGTSWMLIHERPMPR